MADYNITAVTRRVVYTGSAGVGPYAFTFPVISQTDIAVYKNSTKLTLTTNYTAAAYRMTSELPEYYKTNVSFENALEYFFNKTNEDGVTPFEQFMGRIESDNRKEIRDRINQTIAQKTKEGSLIEDKFYEYIT